MKKFIIIPFLAIILMTFSSCSINSQITFHKDTTSTTEMDLDMSVFLGFMKYYMFASGSKKSMSFEKFPKTWESFYSIRNKDSKKPIPADSAKLYKKIFVKSNFEKDEMTGFSMKMDHFSKDDYRALNNREEKDIPLANAAFQNWDGKTLKIKTDEFVSEELQDMLNKMGYKSDDSKSENDEFKMNFTTTLKFETPIKSISGKHPWLKKMDDKTIKIEFSAEDVSKADDNLKNSKEILVVTK
jgi:hypothetical protein